MSVNMLFHIQLIEELMPIESENHEVYLFINHTRMVAGIEVEPSGSRIKYFSHDHRIHDETTCYGCSDEYTKRKAYIELIRRYDKFERILFHQLIHHPSLRLPWTIINSSDYEE